MAGIGKKPPDLVGVWACSSCHDVIDGRNNKYDSGKRGLDSDTLDGLCRTLALVSKELGL